MKLQSLILATLVSMLSISAFAQDKPSSQTSAAARARAAVIKRADALSEDQINQSHDVKSLSKLAQLYNAQHDTKRFIWALKRITELMPNSGNLKLQLAIAYAKIDDKTNAYNTLIHMQMQGFGYDVAKDPRFDPIHGTKVWDYLVANLQVNSKQFGEGKTAYELPKGDYLFDSLAWDAKHKQLLAGSTRDGNIYRVGKHGKLEPFIKTDANNGPWSIYALGVDQKHGKLYAASASKQIYKDFNAENANRAGVFEFDLASGKLLNTYLLPGRNSRVLLTAMTVSAGGKVYVTDGPRRQVYSIDDGKLRPLLQNPKLTNISALAVSGDGRTLYMADYSLGIFGFDLTKGKAFEPRYNPENLVLGGIVGMYWYDGTLVIVEDGMVPKRVMRLQLADDGHTIKGAMPLDVAHPQFVALGRGAVAGSKLYFVANRQDGLYDANGLLSDPGNLARTTIFGSNLRFAWGKSGVGKSIIPVTNGSPGMLDKGPDMKLAPAKDSGKGGR